MFNTFPIQSSQEDSSSTFSSGSEPKLKFSYLPDYYGAGKSNTLEGYASLTGSSIVLPSSPTNPIVCLSSAGSTIYSVTPSAAISGYDQWMGFWLNDDASLLYAVLKETGTSPDTYATITINSSGVVSTVGTDQPSVDFSVARYWSLSGSIIPQDGGGFKLISDEEYAVIDSAGQFTTQPTDIGTDGFSDLLPYLTDDNTYIAGLYGKQLGSSRPLGFSLVKNNRGARAIVTADMAPGIANIADRGGFLRWRDYVVTVEDAVTSNPLFRSALVKYGKNDFESYIAQWSKYSGVTL